MNKAPRTSQPHNDSQTLPLEIYLPLVTSLYKDAQTLLVGTIVVTGSTFVTYWKTDDTVLLYCAVAFALVACVRGLLARAYSYERPTITSDDVCQAMGASLRRGRVSVRRSAWYLVFRRIFAGRRSFRPRRQLYYDGCLRVGHLRAKFWKHTLCDHSSSLCMGADDSGATTLGKSI
jgi:hypothetical protein